MRYPVLFALISFLSFPAFSVGQLEPADAAANPAMPQAIAETEPGPSRFTIPIATDYRSQVLSLTVEGAEQAKFPSALAVRIFGEVVRQVTREVNSTRPVAVRLNLLVKIGGRRDFLECVYGSKYDAVISLSKWSEAAFARLLARGVRDCMFTDKQLDMVAQTALARAHAQVDVGELASR